MHETAHLLGVDHCVYYSCCMNGSGHLAEDFRKLKYYVCCSVMPVPICIMYINTGQSMHLCPVDLRKLCHLCGFNISQRYKNVTGGRTRLFASC